MTSRHAVSLPPPTTTYSNSDGPNLLTNVPNGQLRVPFTPRKKGSSGGSTKVTQIRTSIASAMEEEFVVCGIDKFISHYLEFVPDYADVTECMKKLWGKRVMFKDKDGKLVFTNFRGTPVIKPGVPGESSEAEIFAHLSDIATKIGEYKFPDESRKRNDFKYRNVPNNTIKSNIEGSNNRIDACFTSDPKKSLNTWGIAAPIEQKVDKSNKSWVDNNKKILSANTQIMNDDVRRMFTYGITFEGDQMTLWYHSRSHSAVSESFNFIEHPKTLVKIFMFFLFATPLELGYDPMVKRQADGHYTYEIPRPLAPPPPSQAQLRTVSSPPSQPVSDFYRTVKLIFGYRSNNITGRIPRVWLVEPYDPSTGQPLAGEKLVLKDVWIDHTYQSEKQIQAAIFKGIEEFGDGDPPPSQSLKLIWEKRKNLIRSRDYRQLFLTIENDFSGATSKTIAEGSERILGLFVAVEESYNSTGTSTRSEAGPHHTTKTRRTPLFNRCYTPKKQCRLIFKEVCQSVGEMDTLGEAFDIIRDAHIALQLLYCAGWVHRDISDGNILGYRENLSDSSLPWKGKLMDLEYARPFDRLDQASTDPKTGTPYFMPCEILQNRYFFEAITEKVDNNPDGLEYKPNHITKRHNKEPTSDSEVAFNFQHDLEALWWLMLYLVVSHVKDQSATDWQGPPFDTAVKESDRFVSTVFQAEIDHHDARYRCFRDSFVDEIQAFTPSLLADVVDHLDQHSEALWTHFYKRVKQGLENDKATYAGIHLQFGDFLDGIHEQKPPLWRAYSLKPKPVPPTPTTNEAQVATEPSNPAHLPTRMQPPRIPKVKPKRGPEQNPNLQQQTGSKRGSKRSRQGV